MAASIEIQELAFVLATKNHNPAILSPEFLKCSGIVDAEWELARQPITSPQVAQLVFRNGVSLTAQADRLVFVEAIGGAKPLQEMAVAAVASKYVQALPHAEYQAIGIHLRGMVPFAEDINGAHTYIMSTLLAPGAWQSLGEHSVRASVNLAYTLEQRRLYLTIAEAALQLPEGEPTPIVLFSGNFEYLLSADTHHDRMAALLGAIGNWQMDLEMYRNLINERFLGSDRPVAAEMPSTWSMPHHEPPELVPLGA